MFAKEEETPAALSKNRNVFAEATLDNKLWVAQQTRIDFQHEFRLALREKPNSFDFWFFSRHGRQKTIEIVPRAVLGWIRQSSDAGRHKIYEEEGSVCAGVSRKCSNSVADFFVSKFVFENLHIRSLSRLEEQLQDCDKPRHFNYYAVDEDSWVEGVDTWASRPVTKHHRGKRFSSPLWNLFRQLTFQICSVIPKRHLWCTR